MLQYAAVFFVIALIAAVFGFTGIAVGAAEIAKVLGVSKGVVEWRMREMRRICRRRMAELGTPGGMAPLRVIVSNPRAIRLLREAA